jgi:predicted RNA-binding protein YlxR (DUF448 family)
MARDAQAEMIRIAAAADGALILDEAVRSAGRGGYLHRRAACLTRFELSRVKEFRSLRRRIGLDERRQLIELIRARLASEGRLE